MIKKLFNQKKASSNKRGSMLTLVLVILAMALILITSAITITSSTRNRYIDYTLSSQARATATSIAESLCTAIQNQDILDTELEGMATGTVTVTAAGAPIPGANGAANTSTTLSFSKDTNYIYMDVVTKIGTLGNGSDCVESVRVYFKKKTPPPRSHLFDNMMEVGDSCSFGQFHVGAGAPPGAKNTVFAHGDADLTKQSGNNIISELICTGRLTLGNGGTYTDIVFSGDDAGIKAMSGNISVQNLGFFSTNGNVGSVVPSSGQPENIDMSPQNVIFSNFNVNSYIRGNNVNFYNYNGSSSVNISNSTYRDTVVNSFTANAASTELQQKASTMLSKAQEAIKPENAFKTLAQAEGEFLAGVTATENRGPLPGSVGDHNFNEPGFYTLPTTVNGNLIFDLSKPGGYVLYVSGHVTINGSIRFINGNPSAEAVGDWGRIIIQPGGTLDFGGTASAGSGLHGVIAAPHPGDSQQATALSKPTCFIYGYAGSTVMMHAPNFICDAYIGLFGTGSNIDIGAKVYCCGRMTSTNFISDNCNGTDLPYSPGPHEDPVNNQKSPKTSDYEVVRFRYYYGTAA